jgi:NTE family protein
MERTVTGRRGGDRRRVGLVLGAGGTLGAAWMVGALGAVEERLGRPLQDVDVIVGTSAGSVLAASLRCGFSPADLVSHQRGAGASTLPTMREFERDSGVRPPPPRLRMGSPRLLATAIRAPHRIHPQVAASALILQGRAEHHALRRYFQALGDPSWPQAHTWIMVVDYETGRRVAFGRPGAPTAPLPDAVVASCSIPGWHAPKLIDSTRYVDGGVRSVASVDLLHRERLDEVYVLAPMASHKTDRPVRPSWRAERLVRQMLAAALDREVRKVTATGAKVTVLTPGPADLAAIGINLMDGRRRLEVLETARWTVRRRLGTSSH